MLDAYDAALASSAASVEEAQAAAAALAAQLADAELHMQMQQSTADDTLTTIAAKSAGRSSRHCSSTSGPLAALRQHQKHLEQQLAKQHTEYARLQRENIKLVRCKKQFDGAAQKLNEAVAAQTVAQSAVQEARLRAAAEAGKAEKLQQQVSNRVQAASSRTSATLLVKESVCVPYVH